MLGRVLIHLYMDLEPWFFISWLLLSVQGHVRGSEARVFIHGFHPRTAMAPVESSRSSPCSLCSPCDGKLVPTHMLLALLRGRTLAFLKNALLRRENEHDGKRKSCSMQTCSYSNLKKYVTLCYTLLSDACAKTIKTSWNIYRAFPVIHSSP